MMVTSKVDSQLIPVPKMNSVRGRKPSSSNSSGFRLLDSDQLETSSSVSRNSVYKLKIDLMFDDTRSIRSNRLDDPRGSHRTRSIIMYGRSELASTAGESTRSITSFLQESNNGAKILAQSTKNDVQRISNSVQAQIEQLFTDVAKDATSSFAVKYLGSLPLRDKVTSLQGLQEPLRELYLRQTTNEKRNCGFLDICATGLRVKISITGNVSKSNSNNNKSNNGKGSSSSSNNELNSGSGGDRDDDGDANGSGSGSGNEESITPFHNIAVWSAVKFVMSEEDGCAAFLPLITDPDNIDKASLFQPLSPAEQKRVLTSSSHAPIFAVVMRSTSLPKLLECHGFICKSTEDAIVIAATLYQSLMAHVSSSSHRSTKRRTPRNQNGVSCISIASSSAKMGSNYTSRSQIGNGGRKSSFRSSSGSVVCAPSGRSVRKKRISNSSLSSSSNVINETAETTTEERKRKSHKTKRAPPVPTTVPGSGGGGGGNSRGTGRPSMSEGSTRGREAHGYLECVAAATSGGGEGGQGSRSVHRSYHHAKKSNDSGGYRSSELIPSGAASALAAATASGAAAAGAGAGSGANGSGIRSDMAGDILTRVAIPRSGSFLNTGGLTRYKSRAARRHSDKLGGGGGGSPLGFSELFNEFRLHENLHSLDDILYAIIDADGMSFNDLKPIYKEFLLKLAVTLTKDELFQRSKNIMRRQKKKKLKQKPNTNRSQKKPRTLFFGTKSLKKVFQLGQFRSCRGKPPKPPRNKELDSKQKSGVPLVISHPTGPHHQRSRVATSGSDVSVVRNDNTFPGLNRNSSSGYVSCSECSYDSEACTCISADRCYCSLRNGHVSGKLRHKNERNAALSKKSPRNKQPIYTPSSAANRHSLISCKSDDKCYCSMVEEEANVNTSAENESVHTQQSDTTWCDTDSCISASKCYCKRSERRNEDATSQRRRSRSASRKPSEKLALDYELFTINGNAKSVQPDEALSVKKSVEAAAIFADVKLSQTTDIKSMCPAPLLPQLVSGGSGSLSASKGAGGGSCRSSRKQNYAHKKRDSYSIDRRSQYCAAGAALVPLSSSSSLKSCSADDLLSKLSAIEKAVNHAASIKSGSSKSRDLLGPFGIKENFHSSYQSMRAVSASLEDTLGYLP